MTGRGLRYLINVDTLLNFQVSVDYLIYKLHEEAFIIIITIIILLCS